MPVRKRMKVNLGRVVSTALGGSRCQHDAHGLLDSLEDPRVDFWLMPLGRAVDDPNIVTRLSQVFTHPLKSWPAQKSGYSYEADYAGVARLMVVIYLPGRPAPEVDIEIAQMF